jgi:hypothetical protein
LGPQLKTLVQNPAFKNPELSDKFFELREVMKKVIRRSKQLSEQPPNPSAPTDEKSTKGSGSKIEPTGISKRRSEIFSSSPIKTGLFV